MQVIRQIGAGGFGVVEEIKDSKGNHWAKKTFRVAGQTDINIQDLKKRFKKEVKYQMAMAHPNIVRIVYSDLAADPPYYIMELAANSLQDELNQDPHLSNCLGNVLFDLLSGLQALHEKGIVHRDLKPGNILKFPNGDGAFRFAISDFGLVASLDSESTSLTATNQAGGTPYYAAPECAQSLKQATPQSDIYSFGALLHDVFGGGVRRVPYTKLTVPDAKINPIVEKCTQRAPKLRYSTIEELRKDIFDALNGREIQFTSNEEAELVGLLKGNTTLSDENWDRIIILIDQNEKNRVSSLNLFAAITLAHFSDLNQQMPERFTAIARDFCKFVHDGVFNFDYCDVLGDKVAHVYNFGNVEIKAIAALAILAMGTSHNRWYVEGKFIGMAGKHIEDGLAERIRIEIQANDIDFPKMIEHWERSISGNKNDLHPILLQMLT